MFFCRLAKFLETAASVLNFFEAFLGRIEIKTADKVERVYFEIDEANIEEWEKPQIRESKNAFFRVCISEGEGERMEQFVDFCEDAIFEMQHSASLVEEDSDEGKVRLSKIGISPLLLFADCEEIGPHNAERRRAKRADSSTEGAGRPGR